MSQILLERTGLVGFVNSKSVSDNPFEYSLSHSLTSYSSLFGAVPISSVDLFIIIFYGILIAFSIYNLMIYMSIRNNVYLLYVCHTIFIGLFALTQDGIGLNFLWSGDININDWVRAISLYLTTVSGLLLARKFLGTQRFPIIEKLLIGFIIARTIVFLLGISFFPFLIHQTVEVIFFLSIYATGYLAWIRGYKPARFYVLAFSLFFIGFIINVLKNTQFQSPEFLPFYSFHIAVLANLMLMSYSFADKIKFIIGEREDARKQTIVQLKANEALKDKLNIELEKMVRERTKELEAKNKQLDVFVYKASHDMKGPLRSIMGLTSIGLRDVKDQTARTYLQHIEKSTRRLDNTLKDLIQLARVKESTVEKTAINVYDMFSEILSSLEHLPEFQRMKICREFPEDTLIFSDEKLLYSVFQNLTENAIKYSDAKKEISFLTVSINQTPSETLIDFRDNGTGIDKTIKEQVFEMFFKANEQSAGTGLGLYIVKTSVEKLGGEIQLDSIPSEGSVFTVKLPA